MRRHLKILALACLLAGCAGRQVRAPLVTNYVYHLGGGDKVKLTVYGDTQVTGDYGIDGEGIVSLPLAGNIHAAGMTIGQFRAEVQNRLDKNFMRNAQVSAEVIAYRSVFILGDVTSPGEFPYSQGMTIYSLAAKAGGFTYRANRRLVFIRHDDEAAEGRYELTSGTAVQPGDTVRIGQRVF